MGIIGCGQVGGRLLPRAEALGLRVVSCDPPMAAAAEQRDVGHVAAAALDVWLQEPTPDLALVQRVQVATPHVAGHGYDARVTGSRMVEDALREWLVEAGDPMALPFNWEVAALRAPVAISAAPAMLLSSSDPGVAQARWLDQIVRNAYDLRADDARMRAAMFDDSASAIGRRAEAFSRLRQAYPARRSWGRFVVSDVPPADRAVTHGLCMQTSRG